MGFFARPNLDRVQFRQESGGEPLELSGQTKIHATSGFTLSNGNNVDVVITAEGADVATIGHVLTFDGDKIKLKPVEGGSGGTTYNAPYKSPSTYTVGGLVAGTVLTGKTLSCILQDMLVPTLNPVLTNPSSTFSITPSTSIYEIGSVISPIGSINFNPGSINPQYCSASSCRSNGSITHNYQDFNGITCNCNCVTVSSTYQFPTYSVVSGQRTAYGSVSYSGGVQPKDSANQNYCTPLSPGTTPTSSAVVCGIHPWFWGVSNTAPTVNQALISSYTCKCVADSSNQINVSNFNVTGKYIWFAIPSTSTSKACWQGANNPSNNGVIPGSLFPAGTTLLVDSPEVCWNDVNYKVYVSNYATDVNYGMTFSN